MKPNVTGQSARPLATSLRCPSFVAHLTLIHWSSDRTKVLNASVFESLELVREIIEAWLQRYNQSGPMTRWPACRRPRIEPILKPEVLH